jgi:hypothetical protein
MTAAVVGGKGDDDNDGINNDDNNNDDDSINATSARRHVSTVAHVAGRAARTAPVAHHGRPKENWKTAPAWPQTTLRW